MSAPMNAEKRKSRNKLAGIIAIVSGILLLIGGVTGSAAWKNIGDILGELDPMGMGDTLYTIFMALSIIAMLGGLLVILGGVLIMKEKITVGKLLITIGVGAGLIGLIIAAALAVYSMMEGSMSSGKTFVLTFLTFGGMGILLSIIARLMAKKPE